MPADDYEDYDDYEEVEELDDDIEEVEEFDDVEDVEEVDEDEAEIDRGRKQLQRGRLTEFGDRLKGGASRPGEEEVRKSPFVMVMAGAIAGLAVLALVFFIMLLSASEQRAFDAAADKLKQKAYPEAEILFEKFLEAYPDGEYEEAARIGKHKSKVLKFVAADSFTPSGVHEAMEELNEFISVCRDYPSFAEEREDVRRFSEHFARVGAIVAEDQREQEPLDDSRAAAKLMEQFSAEDIPISLTDEIRRLQNKAEAAILKQNVLDSAVKEIRGYIEVGDMTGAFKSRESLVTRYPILGQDKDVGKVLQEILTKELELTAAEKLGIDAETEDVASQLRKSASLALRTQATVDQVSQGRRVFAVGVDSCYGLDSETGAPLWKRNLGQNLGQRQAFTPMPVDASRPALLVYRTVTEELMMLDQKDGSLIWRQKIPPPEGRPIVYQQQIYLTTATAEASELWQISVGTGRAVAKVKFQRGIVGPPAITSDKKHMLIAGDSSVVYTLSINPLECKKVSYIPHEIGSIEAPILTMGGIYLICDNEAERCRLRVMRMGEDLSLTAGYEEYVEGQVTGECLLRGAELMVPSTPQRVTVFSVDDQPDASPPISRKGANQLENAVVSQTFLRAGPGGQVWMAGQDLRKFKVNANSMELTPEIAAEGQHLQPIQFLDQNVFVTTNEAFSSSVFFTKVQPQEMVGLWRTVIGTNVVAAGPSDSKESMIVVGDFGEVFRVPLAKIQGGEFITDRISRYNIPEKLNDQIGGTTLKDGRTAAYCGGEEPSLWTFTTSGQLEQKWSLPGTPETEPVSIGQGALVAVPGRLHLTADRRGRVEDYRAAQGAQGQASWKSLVALSDIQALAITGRNEAIRVEYRTNPSPHLFEVSKTPLSQTIDFAPAVDGDYLCAATSEGNLQLMSTATLEVLAEVSLGGVPSAAPTAANGHFFVQVRRKQLKVFSAASGLQQTGELDLNGRFLVGAPVSVRGGGFVICLSDGTVMLLDADGNATAKSIQLGQQAQRGPIVVGSSLVVIGLDGSLYSVEDIVN